jgi:hypothetical protein
LLALPAGVCTAQVQTRRDTLVLQQPRMPALRHAVSLNAGLVWPVSRDGLTRFWRSGPAASLSFYVAVNRYVSIGLGLEAAKFRFSRSRFLAAYPATIPHDDNIFWTHVSVGGKLAFLPGMRTNPYLCASIGASRLTEALHREINGQERTTYYYVGGATRLTGALGAGADIWFNRYLAVEFEVRCVAIHNDPDFGIGVSGQAGVHFAF